MGFVVCKICSPMSAIVTLGEWLNPQGLHLKNWDNHSAYLRVFVKIEWVCKVLNRKSGIE